VTAIAYNDAPSPSLTIARPSIATTPISTLRRRRKLWVRWNRPRLTPARTPSPSAAAPRSAGTNLP